MTRMKNSTALPGIGDNAPALAVGAGDETGFHAVEVCRLYVFVSGGALDIGHGKLVHRRVRRGRLGVPAGAGDRVLQWIPSPTQPGTNKT